MKDDALPQNSGMCLPYTYKQRCMLSPHAKHVCEGAHMPMDFPMRINAAQTTKHVVYPGWLLLDITITRSSINHHTHERKPALLAPSVGAE